MQERYERIFEHKSNLYANGFPIAIVAGALLKDTHTGNVLAQLKLRNIGNEKVIACKVSIRAFENNGTETEGINEYSYLDIYATPGVDFGEKNPIYLPDSKARSFEARVKEVVLEDGTVITEPYGEWKQTEIPRPIEELLGEEELVKQFKLEEGGDCCFVPEKRNGLTICSCGAYSLDTNKSCCKCGRSYDELIEHLDAEKLRESVNKRLREEEERQLKNKETKKKGIRIAVIALILLGLLSVVGVRVKGVLDKNNEYNEAIKLKESGQYETAKERFEELNGWKDSEKQIEICDELIVEEKYAQAIEMFNSGDYSNAIVRFNNLDGYKDSGEYIKKAKYESAKIKMKEDDFSGAIGLLNEIGDYEDSEKLKTECSIEQAYQELSKLSIRDDSSIKRAEELFDIIPSGYKDVEDAKEVLEFYKPYIGDYKSNEYSTKRNFRVIKNKREKWVACFGASGGAYVEFEKPELSGRDSNKSDDYIEVRVVNPNRIEMDQIRPRATFNSVYSR